jgi:hypothetical protein
MYYGLTIKMQIHCQELKCYLVPVRKRLISPISASGSNFNPQNTQCMDACPDFIGVVKIIAFLELEKIISFSGGTKLASKVIKFTLNPYLPPYQTTWQKG